MPFATAVLLLALGSDYNIYLVGGIWRAAQPVGIVEGIRTAMPAASLSISVAGLILAGSFGLLALVPIDALRQFAFVMALGAGLDSFVVRPFLVPGAHHPLRAPRLLARHAGPGAGRRHRDGASIPRSGPQRARVRSRRASMSSSSSTWSDPAIGIASSAPRIPAMLPAMRIEISTISGDSCTVRP